MSNTPGKIGTGTISPTVLRKRYHNNTKNGACPYFPTRRSNYNATQGSQRR